MLFNWKLFPGTNLQDLNLDWIINFVKMIPSRLPKFSDHHTWLVYDYSTGEYYDSGEPTGGAGEPGEPGKSPIIGANGNWYTWNTETETYTDTGTMAQGVQGEPGAGVASGGVAGDVLVKASSVDYNTGWTATPPQMGAIAHINAGNTADVTYQLNDYLVYNGSLYRVKDTTISAGITLNPGVGGNIEAISAGAALNQLEAHGYIVAQWVNFTYFNEEQLVGVYTTPSVSDGYSTRLLGVLPFFENNPTGAKLTGKFLNASNGIRAIGSGLISTDSINLLVLFQIFKI